MHTAINNNITVAQRGLQCPIARISKEK